jgi:hypothetical protein
MMSGLKNIKTHKIFDIEYNGWVYVKYLTTKLKTKILQYDLQYEK